MAQNILKKVVYEFTTSVSSATFTASDVNTTTDNVTLANHGYKTGQPVGILAGTTIPTGLTEATTGYYIIVVDASTIAFATSKANAIAGTKVNITGAGAGTNTLYANGAGIVDLGYLPDNFVLMHSWYDVVTTYVTDDGTTPGNDAGTLALSTGQGAGDLVAAIAVSDASNVWDAGIQGTLSGTPTLSTFHASNNPTSLQYNNGTGGIRASIIKMTADRIPTLTFATETATAGSLRLYVEGYQSA